MCNEPRLTDERAQRPIDIVCAGEAVALAVALVGDGLRVGLATVVADDDAGRALRERVAAAGVDVTGVQLAPPTTGLVFVRGGARQLLAVREQQEPLAVPEVWSFPLLLLSGVSPLVLPASAMCKAARAARRAGALVFLDLTAHRERWQGRDARTLRMVLREADVVWCTAEDLLSIDLDPVALRAALRPGAMLARRDEAGRVVAYGPFGEIVRPPAGTRRRDPQAYVRHLAAALARAAGSRGDVRSGDLWGRALASS